MFVRIDTSAHWHESEGKIYDQTGAGVRPHIQAFIDTYQLPLDELLVKDLGQYPVGQGRGPMSSVSDSVVRRSTRSSLDG